MDLCFSASSFEVFARDGWQPGNGTRYDLRLYRGEVLPTRVLVWFADGAAGRAVRWNGDEGINLDYLADKMLVNEADAFGIALFLLTAGEIVRVPDAVVRRQLRPSMRPAWYAAGCEEPLTTYTTTRETADEDAALDAG